MRPKIYLFGDSITEDSFDDGGWGASLANYFSRSADIVLRGYSGYNTKWALHVLEKIFPMTAEEGGGGGSDNGPPLAVTVFFGANDACLPDRCSAFQHVPLHEYQDNLHSIVSSLRKRWPTTLIILITPPPIDEDARLQFPYVENPSGLPERSNKAAGDYAQACVSVATEFNIPVIDLWNKMQLFPEWKKAYLTDGLHLTRSGNKIVFKEVVHKLWEGGLSAESLPADLPLISQIDPKDPLKVFQTG